MENRSKPTRHHGIPLIKASAKIDETAYAEYIAQRVQLPPAEELATGAITGSEAELDRGAALFAAGRAAEAVATLRPLDLAGAQGYSYQNSSAAGNSDVALEFAAVSYYACEQLADHESQSGDLHAAVEDYTNALAWVPQLEDGGNIRPEVLNNNAALAYLGLGETKTAAALESKALAADPKDPVFLMTAGFIADRSGHLAQAARYDRAALGSDPGAFPAANDLGVELMRSHQDGEAAGALRQAIRANSGYALGWFNLGIVESGLGPSHLLGAQGAFAMAYSLDPALEGRQHEATIDASVYRTALDLSKPLPPNWSISQLPQPVPVAAAGLLALGLLALGLAKATGHDGTTSRHNGLTHCQTGLGRRRCCTDCITPPGRWRLPRLAFCSPTCAREPTRPKWSPTPAE